eukprot:g26146.t1
MPLAMSGFHMRLWLMFHKKRNKLMHALNWNPKWLISHKKRNKLMHALNGNPKDSSSSSTKRRSLRSSSSTERRTKILLLFHQDKKPKKEGPNEAKDQPKQVKHEQPKKQKRQEGQNLVLEEQAAVAEIRVAVHGKAPGVANQRDSADVARFIPEQRKRFWNVWYELSMHQTTSDWASLRWVDLNGVALCSPNDVIARRCSLRWYLLPIPGDVDHVLAGSEADDFRIASPGECFRDITLPLTGDDSVHLRSRYIQTLAPLMRFLKAEEGKSLADLLGKDTASGVVKSIQFFGNLSELLGDQDLANICNECLQELQASPSSPVSAWSSACSSFPSYRASSWQPGINEPVIINQLAQEVEPTASGCMERMKNQIATILDKLQTQPSPHS